MSPSLFIGMISGTSRDGVDAALVRFTDDHPEIVQAICVPYPAALSEQLQRLVASGQCPTREVRDSLDEKLAEHFSETALLLLANAGRDRNEVTAIGSHGQTVWHEPDGPNPQSMQLGAPESIARRTGIVTVGDFRRADIEAGGQGAPLAPLLHRALFSPAGGSSRVVLNLGGIANVSIIHAEGRVSGYDTGPANCLMDAWIGLHQGEAFDRDGRWAESGRVNPGLLASLLADPYFEKPPPKSTGVEHFNLAWLEGSIPHPGLAACDVQATLAELTAVSVADAIRLNEPADVLVCGGGVHNSHLVNRLRELLPRIPVRSTADFGLEPDWVEAVLFAWLARERLADRTLDTRPITGAREKVRLGKIARPH